jgi:IclR family acetate operon transcriptional repressor
VTQSATRKRARGRPRGGEAGGATVQALDRGLRLMRLLAEQGEAPLTELALSAGMPASTAHRLLMTLQQHGLVDFDETSQDWMIGVEAFRVGSAFVHRLGMVEASREILRRLVDDTGETANLGIEQGGDVVFLSQVECLNPIRAFFRPGTRGHMHASGIGKALLAAQEPRRVQRMLEEKGLPRFTDKTLTTPSALFADLEATRARGWSFDDEERYAGMRCIASPVFNSYGEAVAGLSISGPSVRFPDAVVAEMGPRVRRAAAELTQKIGGAAPD